LGLPQITYARKVEIIKNTVKAERVTDEGYELVETNLPALITVVKEINEARFPSITDILAAYREREITLWAAEDLAGDKERFGLKGSPTRIKKASTAKPTRGKVKMLEGSAADITKSLVAEFNKRNLL